MTPRLSVNEWVCLSQAVRLKLAEVFGLRKSVGCLVEGGVLKGDGHSYEDLGGINIDGLKEYTGLKSDDFYILFNHAVMKAQGIEVYQETKPEPVEVTAGDLEPVKPKKTAEAIAEPTEAIVDEPEPKKKGRPIKIVKK